LTSALAVSGWSHASEFRTQLSERLNRVAVRFAGVSVFSYAITIDC
jgi:hypothetical protein